MTLLTLIYLYIFSYVSIYIFNLRHFLDAECFPPPPLNGLNTQLVHLTILLSKDWLYKRCFILNQPVHIFAPCVSLFLLTLITNSPENGLTSINLFKVKGTLNHPIRSFLSSEQNFTYFHLDNFFKFGSYQKSFHLSIIANNLYRWYAWGITISWRHFLLVFWEE